MSIVMQLDVVGGLLLGLALVVVVGVLALVARMAGARRAVAAAVVLLCWYAALMAMAARGVLQDFSTFPPPLMRAILATLLLGTVWVWRTPVNALARLPLHAAVLVQSFRFPLELLLHALHADGRLPEQMTWTGANPDILTGLTAPLVALGAWRGWLGARGVLAWNALGVALLVNVVSVAVRSFPGPLRTFMDEPSTAVMGSFPFALVPTLMVPTAALLHLLSIRQARVMSATPDRAPA